MALSRIFDISNRSMQTYQKAIDLTANNITNAANPNYSRRKVSITESKPESFGGFKWGTGVTIGKVQRVRDDFVDKELLVANQNYAKSSKKAWVYDRVEQLFNETSGLGLSTSMSEFFASFNELSTNPASIPLRENVVTSAENLSSKIDDIYGGIDMIAKDVYHEFNATKDTLNGVLKSLQGYNAEIASATRLQKDTSDLEDRRSNLIDQLSNMVNVTVQYDQYNSANISIGGILAVDAMNSHTFQSEIIDGELKLALPDKGITTVLSGGELGALSEIYSDEITDYKATLDTIFKGIVETVNTVHNKGYTGESTPRTGVDFFQEFSGGRLIISKDILDDPRAIAASADGTIGNGDISNELGGIASQEILDGATFTQKYIYMLNSIGNRSRSANDSAEANSLVKGQLENQRSEYSGVSIDEEMSNIILFQKSYDASARLVRIADEMLEQIINMV